MIEIKEYLKSKLLENELNKEVLYNKKVFKEFLENTLSNCSYSSYQRKIREAFVDIKNSIENDDLLSDNIVKLQANKQALQDKNNVERKINRESNRLYNHLSELYQEYIRLMKEEKIDLKSFKIKSEKIQENKNFGIVHFSDLHINKLIKKSEDVGNEFNFTIASKRLKKFVTEAIFYFKVRNIKNVGVVFTGDLINSDRRIGEMLNQVTNRTKASLLACYLLKQVLLELNQHFGLKIAHCVGNESRLSDIMESNEMLASHNLDYLIFNNLRLLLADTNIEFVTGANPRENIVSFGNFNALLIHGDTLKTKEIGKELNTAITKYALRGIKIHAVWIGHHHVTGISNIISRCASLCGADPFPAKDLHLCDGLASQNIYLLNSDNTYDGIMINLQNVDNVEGYSILKELEVYAIEESIKPNNEVIIRNFI